MAEERVQGAGIFGRFLQPRTDGFYFLFRLAFAALLGLHGAQKAFLLWDFPAGANPNGMGALLDIAGWVELVAAGPHRARHSDPTGSGSHGCNDDCRLLWSTRRPQPCMALAASVS